MEAIHIDKFYSSTPSHLVQKRVQQGHFDARVKLTKYGKLVRHTRAVHMPQLDIQNGVRFKVPI